jgi:hypothetical protein
MFYPGITSPGSFYLSSFMEAIEAYSIPPILAGISYTGSILLIDLITLNIQTISPLSDSKPSAISDFKMGNIAFGYEDSTTAII